MKTRIAIGTALIAVLVVVLASAVIASRSPTPDNTTAPLLQAKRAQIAHLHAVERAALPPEVDDYNPVVRATSLRDTGRRGVGLYIRHTYFRIVGDIAFDVDRLSALLVPVHPGQPVILDDPESFVFKPLQGNVVMPPRSLTALFNTYLTDYPHSALRRIAITTDDDGRLKVAGQTAKIPGLWLDFTMDGPVALVDHHLFVYRPDHIDIEGLPAAGLLKIIRLQLARLVQIDTQGAQIEGDAIVLDLNHALPPPRQDVHVAAMHLDRAGLHLSFTNPEAPATWPAPILDVDSYVLLDGGDLKNLRALITGVRMQLVPAESDSKARLDTSLYAYRQQLVDGHLGITQAGGLVAYMAPLARNQGHDSATDASARPARSR